MLVTGRRAARTTQDGANNGGPSQFERNTPPLNAEVLLLQTPSVADAEGGHARRGGARSGEALLPGQAVDHATDWGKYTPAIRRWEQILRPAPAPTQPSTRTGKPQLSPVFVEWMMGWPEGHVTDPALWADKKPSAARNAQLKICGNGVVSLQAVTALEDMGIRELLGEGVAA